MLKNTADRNPDSYEFAGLLFSLKDSKVVCLETQKEIILRRNLTEFLLLLLKSPQKVIEYQEFRDGVSAWTVYKDVGQLTRSIHVTKGELVKNLRSLRKNFDLIEAVPGKGYRLGTEVKVFRGAFSSDNIFIEREDSQLPPATISEKFSAQGFFGGHWRHAFFACTIYASLFVAALYIEIAYQFDTFKNLAFKLTLPVFLGIWLTSAFGLFLGWKFSVKHLVLSFIIPPAVFLTAGVVLYLFITHFLPDYTVTQASFQTYPAAAAYLKSVFYFVPLGVFLIALPFSTVIWLKINAETKKEEISNRGQLLSENVLTAAALIISPKLLLILTVAAMLGSLWAMAHLLENLEPSHYVSFFVQLVLWRWFLYFGLAAECLIWYRFSLNTLKH